MSSSWTGTHFWTMMGPESGVDYVPAHPVVLYGHHFAAIAGAGPIVGPVLAAEFGWAAVALWIVLGCIFVGSMHDMVTLFLSVRHEGKSIGSVIEEVLGRPGKMIFLLFCFAALVLVMSVFTGQVADSFVSNPEVATSSLLGIFEAALFGVCVYRFHWSVKWASFVFVPVLFLLVWFGVLYPCDLVALFGVTAQTARTVWVIVLFVYCFVASTLPVWLLLQPRDYLNSYLLYAMLAIGLVAVLWVHPTIQIDAFSGFTLPAAGGGSKTLFPVMRNAATARSMKLSAVFSGSPICPQKDASPCAKSFTGGNVASPVLRSACVPHATARSARSATTPSRSMPP